MTREGVIYGIAGTCFGLILGWIIGSQQAGPRPVATAAPAATQSAPAPAGNAAAPPPIDLQRASTLEQQAKGAPAAAAVRAELGNLYFDGQRFDLAIPWYEAAYKLDPKNINVSTDLAVSYYYTEQADKALAQLDKSLALDPKHATTLLNQGIVRAFGKQDFKGAIESWDKVISYAPNSSEAAKARTLKEAHGSAATGGTGGRGGL
jgi:tetratricopeptide (TPR) repeat protein